MTTRGILLAGGSGTRLHPLTRNFPKSLLGIFDKQMIYYPLSTLVLGGITEILLITTPEHQHLFKELLGDGSQWGIRLEYASQPSPDGLAQALIIAEDFLDGHPSCLILGDNLYHGPLEFLRDQVKYPTGGCHIFAKEVHDPERFGVVEFDSQQVVISLEEKPTNPKSNYAVPGLYLFDNTAPDRAKKLKPSARGELEITDLIKTYWGEDLFCHEMGRSMVWLDTGTPEALLDAANYIHTVQKHSGTQVADMDDIARRLKLV